MLNKSTSPFGGSAFKQSLEEQSNRVLSATRQKQENAKPKAMDKNNARDYNVIIFMRHSKRIDQHPKFAPHLKWDEKDEYLRPYDPPLCDFDLPIKMTKEVQTFIPSLNITKIVLSPFLRCVQTAAVIAKYLNVKVFVIDARLGENALAINRCCRHAQNKKNKNDKIKYVVPKDYNNVTYLTIDQIKKVIADLYKKGDDTNNEEEKKQNNEEQIENELIIQFNHKEKAGNNLHVECVKEYKNILIQQQQQKQNKNDKHEISDVLMISHGQVVSDISEAFSGKLLTVSECGWLCVTHKECGKIYSPSAVSVLYDKNQTQ